MALASLRRPAAAESCHSGTPPVRRGGAVKRSVLVVLVAVSFTTGIGFDRFVDRGSPEAGAESSLTDLPEFETFQQAWDLIHSDYVDESAIDDQTLVYGAAKGMVESLGDTGHSTFLTPEEAQSFAEQTRGELTGIGVQIDFTGGQPVVVAPIDDSPADDAGIRSKDVITAIDGQSTDGLSQLQVSEAIHGDVGTTVVLTISRPSDASTFSVTLTRATIEIKPVSWALLPDGVAQVRLSQFTTGATTALQQAIKDAKAAGATSLVFDLRDNPGGLVSEAVGVASQFLPEGKAIYQFQERSGDPRPVKSVGVGVAMDLPMIVLVNGGSASAAEIVSAGLRDNGRAEIVGETTFGTGTVLVPFPLDDGSSLVLGTALWLTPNGTQLWHKGVTPDKVVAMPADAEPNRPNDDADVTAAELKSSGDDQLREAFVLLTTK